jgi:hypothetical protein
MGNSKDRVLAYVQEIRAKRRIQQLPLRIAKTLRLLEDLPTNRLQTCPICKGNWRKCQHSHREAEGVLKARLKVLQDHQGG